MLSGNHADGKRPFRADARFGGDLGNHRQQGIDHVLGSTGENQNVGDQGSDEGNVLRLFLHNFTGEGDQVIQPPGGLHGCQGGNHRNDHSQHDAGRGAGRKLEKEHKNQQADAANRPQPNAAHPRADDDTG